MNLFKGNLSVRRSYKEKFRKRHLLRSRENNQTFNRKKSMLLLTFRQKLGKLNKRYLYYYSEKIETEKRPQATYDTGCSGSEERRG